MMRQWPSFVVSRMAGWRCVGPLNSRECRERRLPLLPDRGVKPGEHDGGGRCGHTHSTSRSWILTMALCLSQALSIRGLAVRR